MIHHHKYINIHQLIGATMVMEYNINQKIINQLLFNPNKTNGEQEMNRRSINFIQLMI